MVLACLLRTQYQIKDKTTHFFSFGGTNSFSLSSFFFCIFNLASARFFVAARSAFCFSLRKYSPLSICRSTLLGVIWFSGGNGVYLSFSDRTCPTSSPWLLSSSLEPYSLSWTLAEIDPNSHSSSLDPTFQEKWLQLTLASSRFIINVLIA